MKRRRRKKSCNRRAHVLEAAKRLRSRNHRHDLATNISSEEGDERWRAGKSSPGAGRDAPAPDGSYDAATRGLLPARSAPSHPHVAGSKDPAYVRQFGTPGLKTRPTYDNVFRRIEPHTTAWDVGCGEGRLSAS